MIIITGASDGLGKELARQFKNAGKQVVSLSRSVPADGIEHIQADLMSGDSIDSAIETILAKDTPIEALINNAGVISAKGESGLSFKEIQRIMQTNLNSVMQLTSGLEERILKDKGDIVIVSSTHGDKIVPNSSPYSVSKWALQGFANNLQAKLQSTDTRVIGFYPGGFKSDIMKKVTGKERTDPENWVDVEDMAGALVNVINLPKNMEVTKLVIARKKKS